jgi:hypothetical protein
MPTRRLDFIRGATASTIRIAQGSSQEPLAPWLLTPEGRLLGRVGDRGYELLISSHRPFGMADAATPR